MTALEFGFQNSIFFQFFFVKVSIGEVDGRSPQTAQISYLFFAPGRTKTRATIFFVQVPIGEVDGRSPQTAQIGYLFLAPGCTKTGQTAFLPLSLLLALSVSMFSIV